jgi:L-asparagine transporter-like permease
VSSRILFRLAERGNAPKSLLKLTPNKVPRLAVLLSSVIGYVAIVAAIAGVLTAMGTDPALRPQLMASAASLAVASAAYLLTAKRQPRDSSTTGYLPSIGEQAIEGSK